MRTITIIICLLVCTISFSAQDIYKATDGEISFFSEAPVENISAVNKDVKALINAKNAEVAFIVTNVGFKFEKPLMEEHFNENYMESHKYKVSVFKGKIINEIDFTKDGTYEVTAKGTLDIHGVTVEREIKGTLTISNGKINLTTAFDVLLKDHKIKIPKIVVKNIAEFVKVILNINFEQK
ncbi:MAG: YceI family protein [Flavobacteriales bacterium CG_4_10_14_0_8_um_filter_32_5]|nr:MAG: YceI family protein [Flavobacteriales bacterium CG_4_10_14_0_8_um_filter_32_5]